VRATRREFLNRAVGVATLPLASRAASAQSYPTRPVRIIVATSAGGATDIAARIIAQWLTERLGQTFFVENRPGGGNNIGTEVAVRAPPDGYTLFMANTVNAINTTFYDNLSFNFVTDMVPVIILMRSPVVMQVHPSVAAKTVPEFIAYAKANPGKINMGSGGTGATGHVSGELFQMMAGIKMTHVPYRGEALALTDLIAGQVHVVFASIGSSIGYIRAGQVRALAVTTAARVDALPDVPPLADFLPGYEAGTWNGLCAPKNTPAAIIETLNKEINAALADAKIQARFLDLGAPVIGGSAAAFGRIIAEDTEKWAKVIKVSGAKAK
jgi:tripartite-type tricarboxylate transporter receptor subunit TctC